MVDLHSHFLYGVDDGAKTFDTSLEMLIQAESVGITKLLATPHVNAHTTPAVEKQIESTFKTLSRLTRENGIAVDLKLSAEVNVISSPILWWERPWVLIGDKYKYVLIETPFFRLPMDFSDILFKIRLKKITPVLAHPERNIDFQRDPSPLIEWINQGCLVQVDAGSIFGQFGKKCQRFTERLLKAGAVHLVGSDAHDPRGRNYRALQTACQKVESDFDATYAQSLFNRIPARIWDGKKVSVAAPDESVLQLSQLGKIRKAFLGR
jgi:protein-tyrosine phosphatase